jgi:protein arginine N-methyltransferase 1
MYSLQAYGRMIGDQGRVEAYSRALERTVRPGSTVLDIGTGTGIFALLACRYGAKHVVAVEPDDVIELAREIAAANGYDSRIDFVQGISTKLCLAELADVIVSDLHGVLPLLKRGLPAIIDARRRLLAEGGALIPQLDRLWVAPADLPDANGKLADVWRPDYLGFDLTAGRPFATNTVQRQRIAPEAVVLEPRCWASLDYRKLEDVNVRGGAEWSVEEPRTAHGVALWFDSELVDGVAISNAPGKEELIYGQLFLPFSSPVDLATGDEVAVRIDANLFDDDYVYRWSIAVREPENAELKLQLDQSSFYAAPLTAENIQRGASNHAPRLGDEGTVDYFILSRMNEGVVLSEIAIAVRDRFPQQFQDEDGALARVAKLSQRYSI